MPPGGWRWKCPVHGVVFKADVFPELLAKVFVYKKANKLGIPGDMAAGLQDDMCRQNGWDASVYRVVE